MRKPQRPSNPPPDDFNEATSQDDESGTPVPPMEPGRKRGRRLRTLTHVKRGLAAVIRQLELGTLAPKRGNALVYAYSTPAGVMAGDVALEISELRRTVTKAIEGRFDA